MKKYNILYYILKSIKMEYYKKILNCNSEEELLYNLYLVFDDLSNEGINLNITKKDIIKYSREKKNSNKEIWTKQVAVSFGNILKLLKKIDFIEKNKTDVIVKKGYVRLYGILNSHISNVFFDSSLNFEKMCTKVSCGGNHILFLTNDLEVYVLGSNTFGQLGIPDIDDEITTPIKLPTNYNSINIEAGHSTSYIITDDHELYTWGCCQNGRIGQLMVEEDEDIICIPTKCYISGYVPISVQSGSVHSCILTDKGKILSTGHKYYTGHNNNKDVYTYKIIDSIKDICFEKISIGPGGYHTMALTKTGNLYTWGHNRVGQLSVDVSLCLDGPYIKYPLFIVTNFIVKDISAGWGHSAIIDYSGNLYTCGRNDENQIYHSTDICSKNMQDHFYLDKFTLVENHYKYKNIICGGSHTIGITCFNEIYGWGVNDEKQLCNEEEDETQYTIRNNKDIQTIYCGNNITILLIQ